MFNQHQFNYFMFILWGMLWIEYILMGKNNNIILRKEECCLRETYFYTVLLNYSIMWSTEHKFSFIEKSVWRRYTKDYVQILKLKLVAKSLKTFFKNNSLKYLFKSNLTDTVNKVITDRLDPHLSNHTNEYVIQMLSLTREKT